jgi:release factor glutamine methyltransferase
MIATVTAADLLTDAAARLAAAGIESPRREARLLLALALDIDSAALLPGEREISDAEQIHFAALLARRLQREPYSRIAGKREFWSLDLALSPDTLDPRPDSETLIEAALAHIPDRAAPLTVIDFGTGSGALLLALLTELPSATGIGIDLLPGAAAMARANAESLGLAARARFVAGEWGGAVAASADVILANPPYLNSTALAELAPEIADYDPPAALDGGADGLAAYRSLAGDVARLLRPSGLAFLEIGLGQADAVAAIMAANGLILRGSYADLSGVARCLVFVKRTKQGKSFK